MSTGLLDRLWVRCCFPGEGHCRLSPRASRRARLERKLSLGLFRQATPGDGLSGFAPENPSVFASDTSSPLGACGKLMDTQRAAREEAPELLHLPEDGLAATRKPPWNQWRDMSRGSRSSKAEWGLGYPSLARRYWGTCWDPASDVRA